MYGKVTVGYGTNEQKELGIVDFVQSEFKDHRLITISQLEDGTITGVVENPPSTGRNTQSSIWLSKESFIGFLTTAMLYLEVKGENIQKMLDEVVNKGEIQYSFSDNLNDNHLHKE